MKELSKNEMQAVSGAGLFDFIFDAVSDVFQPITDSIAKGLGDMIAKGVSIIGNLINKDLFNKD